MSKKKGKTAEVVCRDNTVVLKAKGKGAYLKDVVHLQDGKVIKYALAYINPVICWADNGRVLGYDNAHNYHHRHFMGKTEAIEFVSYDALFTRFEAVVRELWRQEDGEKDFD